LARSSPARPLIEKPIEPVAVSALFSPTGVLYALAEGVKELERERPYGVPVALGALTLEEEAPRSGADVTKGRRVTREIGVGDHDFPVTA
jgi:hypothetical protein